MSIKEENVIREYTVSIGETPSAGVFRVLRAFYMKVVNGPNIEISPGQLVELGKESQVMLFSIGKIVPEIIPEKYKVKIPFRTTVNGLFSDLRLDDIVEFDDPEEALDYWRK